MDRNLKEAYRKGGEALEEEQLQHEKIISELKHEFAVETESHAKKVKALESRVAELHVAYQREEKDRALLQKDYDITVEKNEALSQQIRNAAIQKKGLEQQNLEQRKQIDELVRAHADLELSLKNELERKNEQPQLNTLMETLVSLQGSIETQREELKVVSARK